MDTVGAGDFFTSGCLYGLLSGASLKVRCAARMTFVRDGSVDSAAAECNCHCCHRLLHICRAVPPLLLLLQWACLLL